MSVAESDLGANGNHSNGSGSKNASIDRSADSSRAADYAGFGRVEAGEGDTRQVPPEADGIGGSDSEDCLAHAQVQMPWLDFNARLQLKGGKKKEPKPRTGPESGGFRIPGLSVRKMASKNTGTRGGSNNGKAPHRQAEGNAEGSTAAAGEYNGTEHNANMREADKGCPNEGIESGAAKPGSKESDNWTEQDLSVPKKKSVFNGCDGLFISIAGIALPSLVLFLTFLSVPKRLTLVILNHPLETIVELLLVFGIPLANYFVWSAITKKSFRFSLLKGMALGSAVGTSVIIAAVCIAAVFAGQSMTAEVGTEFRAGFTWIALLFLMAGAASTYLANRARLTHDFDKSRLRILSVTIAGVVMSVLAFAAAEARPWYIRIAEEKALSNVPAEKEEGWSILRALNPEKEILMECSDARAAGLPGLFLPIKSSTQHQLYFALTGKPYSFKDIANNDLSSMPDDYLSRHVVGEIIPGLSMTRSSMTGLLHPNSLSSTLDWTFVFKNQGQSSQEARAEIGLPPGAVITGLTLWNKGEPQEASFAASGKAEKYVTTSAVAGHDSPAVVTDLGHGRMLLHCFPVKDAEELKVRVTMVMPLKPDGARSSTLALPRLIAENFAIGDEHQIRLRSNQLLGSTSKSLTRGANPDGTQAISGSLTKEQLENANVLVTVQRNEFSKPIAVLDKLAIEFQKEEDYKKAKLDERLKNLHQGHRLDTEILSVSIDGSRSIQKQFEELTNALEKRATVKGSKKKPQIKAIKPKYVLENVNKIAAPAPKNLLIVLDGSATLKEYRLELLKALSNIPDNVPSKLLIASTDEKTPPVYSIKQGIEKLSAETFIGGHDNLKSVVKAAELAGETNRGAVLWIHGPQPILNQEIYIMSPYVAAPTFYELPLGAGDTDTFDFFKNHTEIGPFSQVPRSSRSVSEDLVGFFSKWKANQNGYETTLTQITDKPEQALTASPEEARELLALHADQEVKDIVLARHIRKSARVAVAYGLVTPVSCAVVSPTNNSDIDIDDAALANRNADEQERNSSNTSSMFANAIPGTVPSSTPSLQDATNGTIGQGTDATYVTGVNTAGTVRVNNLANLEALLNIIANLFEVGLALVGGVIILHGLVSNAAFIEVFGQEIEVNRLQRIALGVGLILLGLAFPGLINWFVASARDANLFS